MGYTVRALQAGRGVAATRGSRPPYLYGNILQLTDASAVAQDFHPVSDSIRLRAAAILREGIVRGQQEQQEHEQKQQASNGGAAKALSNTSQIEKPTCG